MTPKQVREAWIKALRSGEYKQTKSYLRKDDSYCCLGVLCDLAVKEGVIGEPIVDDGIRIYGGRKTRLPAIVATWAGLASTTGSFAYPDQYPTEGAIELTGVNDIAGYTFNQIADFIDSDPKGMFTEVV